MFANWQGEAMKHLEPQSSKGSSDKFTGDVFPTTVVHGGPESPLRVWSVHFAPCARTAWHSHINGQYLHIVEGTALVQERDGDIVVLKPGQTIYTPPGVEHWHGASRDSFMVHLAIWEGTDEADVADTNWGVLVSDDEYNAH